MYVGPFSGFSNSRPKRNDNAKIANDGKTSQEFVLGGGTTDPQMATVSSPSSLKQDLGRKKINLV